MFPSDRLNKAFVLAPMAAVPPAAFTPAGTTPGSFTKPNYSVAKNLQAWGHLQQAGEPGFFPDTGTKVVRLWADWNAIQLYGPKFNNSPSLEALDSNIAAAKGAGLTVILTSRGFPGWVTGYAAQTPGGDWLQVPDNGSLDAGELNPWLRNFGPDGSPLQEPAKRAVRAARDDQGALDGTTSNASAKLQLRWPGTIADADANGNGSQNKNTAHTSLLAPGQPWNQWITFLARRYHPSNQGDTIAGAPPRVVGASIDVLEVVNEPNLECWPQVATDLKTQIAPRMTAEMIRQTVTIQQAVNVGAPTPLYFAAPATSDFWRATDRGRTPGAERFTSSYDRFLRRVVRLLGLTFDPGTTFIFTHHNYLDIERPRRARPMRNKFATRGVNSAAWVLALMLGNQVRIKPTPGATTTVPFRWKGWPDASAPCLALTEGGPRIKRGLTKADQPDRVRTAFRETREGRYGNGIVLFSNFLTWKDVGTTITTSHFVDRTVTRDGTRRDVEALTAEPTLDEYREQLQRPVYRTWKALHETHERTIG